MAWGKEQRTLQHKNHTTTTAFHPRAGGESRRQSTPKAAPHLTVLAVGTELQQPLGLQRRVLLRHLQQQWVTELQSLSQLWCRNTELFLTSLQIKPLDPCSLKPASRTLFPQTFITAPCTLFLSTLSCLQKTTLPSFFPSPLITEHFSSAPFWHCPVLRIPNRAQCPS